MAINGLLTRPLYLQVRDVLAERIESGLWKPGQPMPNEGDLAHEYGVSAGTIRKALGILESERLVTRKQGRGTFVNDQASDELAIRFTNIRGSTGKRIAGDVQSLEVAEGEADELERVRLHLQEHDIVYRVRNLRRQNAQPFMVEQASMPAALFPAFPMNNGHHPIVLLAQQNGILMGKAEERISIGLATPADAEALGVDPLSPILVLDRILLTLNGRPIEWRVGRCHFSEQHYSTEIG